MLLIAAAMPRRFASAAGPVSRRARDPLVLILHVGFAWLPLGLLLLGLSILGPSVPATLGDARPRRGRDGDDDAGGDDPGDARPYRPRAARRCRRRRSLYALVTLGAALRVAAPVLPFDYMHMIECAGLLWGGAFLLFVLSYGPKLVGPRPDGRP